MYVNKNWDIPGFVSVPPARSKLTEALNAANR